MRQSAKNIFLLTLLIGLCYSFTGTGYLTWIFRAANVFQIQIIDLFGNVIDYFFQAAGILVAAIALKSQLSKLRIYYYVSMVLELIFMSLAIFISDSYITFVFAIAMDFCFGILFACVLCLMPTLPANAHGIAIGIGWAIGSIASYLISIPSGGSFLLSSYSLILYIILAIGCIFLFQSLYKAKSSNILYQTVHTESLNPEKGSATLTQIENSNASYANSKQENSSITMPIILSVLVIILLETTMNLGFLFPLSDITSGAISFEFSRSFYAIGLIVAGLVFAKSKSSGTILCLCALVCPFLSLLIENYEISGNVLWAINYILLGPIMVYSTILFTNSPKYGAALAGLGLFGRRIGQILSYSVGMKLKEYPPLLIIVTFGLLVLSFFAVYMLNAKLDFMGGAALPALTPKPAEDIPENNTIGKQLSEGNTDTEVIEDTEDYDAKKTGSEMISDPEEKQAHFCEKYGISVREKEVMRLVLEGDSNPIIAAKLYVSENTIKFHMKNILKKTGVQNRSQLRTIYDEFE